MTDDAMSDTTADAAPVAAAPPESASPALLVLGASRGIGKAAVAAALARGARVRALARDPSDLADAEGLERVAADARDGDALAKALEGMDAVLYAIGTPGGARGPFGPPVDLHSAVTEALVAAMEAHGPRRLLAVTGWGAGDSAEAMSRLERTAHRLALGRPYADKDRQEALIRASALDWTILRPVILRDAPARGCRVLRRPEEWRNGFVSREDVAEAMVAAALDGTLIGEAPVLSW